MSVPRASAAPDAEMGFSPAADAVRAELRRIFASDDFRVSERNRAFLEYVVEETLAGRAAQIKGFTVALSVFHRDAQFDPQTDPVVRIEASRLRRALERYYLTAGKDDALQIDLPKGGYVPRFEAKASASPETKSAPPLAARQSALPRPKLRWLGFTGATALIGAAIVLAALSLQHWHPLIDANNGATPSASVRPAVAVLPMENITGDANQDYLAKGISEEMVIRLTHFTNLAIIPVSASFKYPPDAEPTQLARDLRANFVLRGSVGASGGSIRISVQLLDAVNGASVWASSFKGAFDPNAVFQIEEDVAESIVARVAAPYGVIPRSASKQVERGGGLDLEGYRCWLKFYDFRRAADAAKYKVVHNCLEQAVKSNPEYSDFWAALAINYLDGYRFMLDPDATREDANLRAYKAAQQAVALDDESAVAHIAMSAVQFHRGEFDASRTEAHRALQLNPNNPEVLATVAARLEVLGDWDEGAPLMKKAFLHDPDPPAWYHFMVGLDAYNRHDFDTALDEFRGPGVRLAAFQVVLAAVYGDLGHQKEASAAIDAARTISPKALVNIRAQLEYLIHDRILVDRLIGGLQKIGIDVDAASG